MQIDDSQRERATRHDALAPRQYTIPLLALITLVGSFLRLHDIYSATPFMYEYAWTVDLIPGHAEALRSARASIGPLHMPGYDWITYWMATFVGTDYGTLRLPGALMNALGIPLLYLLVRGMSGTRAGLIAALFFAISPTQIWWSQTVTTYAFTITLAMLSLLLVQRSVQRSSVPLLLGALAVNSLLMFLHIFFVFLIAAQSCYLLLVWLKERRLLGIWIAGNLVTATAVVLYLLPNRPYYYSAHPQPIPPLSFWIAKIFGDDLFTYTLEFSFEGWSLFPEIPIRLLGIAPILVSNLTFLLTMCITLYLFVRNRPIIASWFLTPTTSARSAESGGFLLLTLLKLVAISGVAFACLIGLPVFPYRLTYFTSIALYGWLGMSLAGMATRMRVALILPLLLTYTYQVGVVHIYKLRTDWVTPIEFVESRVSESDLILIYARDAPVGAWIWNRETGGSATRVQDAFTVTDTLAQANAHLTGPARSVWIVLDDDWHGENPLKRILDEISVPHIRFPSYGVAEIVTYQVHTAFAEAKLDQAVSMQLRDVSCEDMLAPLQPFRTDTPGDEACIQLLQFYRGPELDWYYLGSSGHGWAALESLARGHADLAEALSNLAIAENPRHPYGHFAKGVVIGSTQGLGAARPYFEVARLLDTRLVGIFEPLIDALYDATDAAQIEEALAPLLPTHLLPESLQQLAQERMKVLEDTRVGAGGH